MTSLCVYLDDYSHTEDAGYEQCDNTDILPYEVTSSLATSSQPYIDPNPRTETNHQGYDTTSSNDNSDTVNYENAGTRAIVENSYLELINLQPHFENVDIVQEI